MKKNSYKLGPDSDGNFGLFGGRYVAETLIFIILRAMHIQILASLLNLTL